MPDPTPSQENASANRYAPHSENRDSENREPENRPGETERGGNGRLEGVRRPEGEPSEEEGGEEDELAQRRSGRRKNEVRVGMAVALAALTLFLGVRFLEDVPLWSGSYPLYAEFESAGGLLEGARVTASGVKVGTVEEVKLNPEGQGVRVGLSIEEGVRLPQGTRADIEGLAAMNDVSVALERGAPANPPLEAGAQLPAAGPGVLETLTQRAGPMARQLDSTLAGAAGLTGQLDALLAASSGDLRQAATNLRATSASAQQLLAGKEERLGRILSSVETLTAELNGVSSDLRGFTGSGGDSLMAAIARANAALRQLEAASRSARRSSRHLETFTAQLASGEGSLGRLASDPSLYEHTNALAVRLDSVLADFQKRPGHYLSKLKLVDVF